MNILKCKRALNNKRINFEDIKTNIADKFILEAIKDYAVKKDVNGKTKYYTDIYVDYTDKLDSDTIMKIVQSQHPSDAFWEIIYNEYSDSEDYIIAEVLNRASENIDDRFEDYFDDSETRFSAEEFICENMNIVYPFNHYRNQKVSVDVVVDAGDGNYDFTLNNLDSLFDEDNDYIKEDINNSSLVWLAKQQGYSIEDVRRAVVDNEYNNSKFLESLYEESLNTTSHMNALTFLVNMTLGELIDYMDNVELINSVEISNNCNCGLVDFWNGGGSVINIALDKPVVIPFKYIDDISLDGERGRYGIDDIYGYYPEEWNGEMKINILKDIKADFDIIDLNRSRVTESSESTSVTMNIAAKNEFKEILETHLIAKNISTSLLKELKLYLNVKYNIPEKEYIQIGDILLNNKPLSAVIPDELQDVVKDKAIDCLLVYYFSDDVFGFNVNDDKNFEAFKKANLSLITEMFEDKTRGYVSIDDATYNLIENFNSHAYDVINDRMTKKELIDIWRIKDADVI